MRKVLYIALFALDEMDVVCEFIDVLSVLLDFSLDVVFFFLYLFHNTLVLVDSFKSLLAE